jgi:hypothetical protein
MLWPRNVVRIVTCEKYIPEGDHSQDLVVDGYAKIGLNLLKPSGNFTYHQV